MKSKNSNLKKRTQKQNISELVTDKSPKYTTKNISKKYIYKKEKAADTDKVLQNNKLSKNYILSPKPTKKKDKLINKNIANSDLRRPPEMREDVSIDYEKYQHQTLHNKHPSIGSLNFMNNIPTSPILKQNELNQNYYSLERKNGFMSNCNRSVDNLITNKWKCSRCGNVNSNFNYLCNNCNTPNSSLPNDTISINQRNNSTSKNIKSLNIDNNIINSSFNSNLSNNIFSKSINNTIMKKHILKKNNTKNNLSIKNNNNIIPSPYYSNVGFNTIRPNKNNNNYFYNEPINNSINNSSNFYETERDSNITHLYSYSNYLANELKTSNDANIKLMENYQNNENEYKNIYEQNDLIKKKIKVLREKENQLDKINEQLQKSLQFIHKKFENKSNINDNNYILNSLIENGEKNLEDINSKINKYNEENEKLSEKLKENKNLINDMKKRIEELSEKNNNDININLKQKIQYIIEIKNNIEKYSKELKE